MKTEPNQQLQTTTRSFQYSNDFMLLFSVGIVCGSRLTRDVRQNMSSSAKIIPISDNLRAVVQNDDQNRRAAMVHFQAKESEEPISFRVTTSARIISSKWWLPQLRGGGHYLMLAEASDENSFCVMLDRCFLDKPFVIGIELDVLGDPKQHIASAEIWTARNSRPSLVYIEFD